MYFIQTDPEGRVIAHTGAESNPDENIWQESPWEVPPEDFDDWVYAEGELVHDPRDLPPVPYTAEQVLSTLLQETEVLDALPDSALEHMAPYMAEWEVGVEYRIGDLVQFGERPYRCLQAHESIQEWDPAEAVSLWARVLAGQGDEIPVWEQPDSTNPYMKGDRVRYPDASGPVYESDCDYNVYEPTVAMWHVVEGGE